MRLHLAPAGRWSEAPEEQLEQYRHRLEDAAAAMRHLLLVSGLTLTPPAGGSDACSLTLTLVLCGFREKGAQCSNSEVVGSGLCSGLVHGMRVCAGDTETLARVESSEPCSGYISQEDSMARSEVQVWLTRAVSRLPVPRTAQCRQFSRLLPGHSGDAGPNFAKALLTLAAERHAPQVTFKPNPRRARCRQTDWLWALGKLGSTTYTLNREGYSDEKVANRDTKVWHGATENGP
jgi:hypothetical protein